MFNANDILVIHDICTLFQKNIDTVPYRTYKLNNSSNLILGSLSRGTYGTVPYVFRPFFTAS